MKFLFFLSVLTLSCAQVSQKENLLKVSSIVELYPTNAQAGDNFATCVDDDSSYIAGGSPTDNVGSKTKQGSVTVFDKSNFAQTSLLASDGAAADYFGNSLSLSGTQLMVGAYAANQGTLNDAGAVYQFATPWHQVRKLVQSDPQAYDYFGNAISMVDDKVLIGAYRAKQGTFASCGAVYVFDTSGNQLLKLVPTVKSANLFFGTSVAQNSQFICGATGYSSNRGGIYVFDLTGTQVQFLSPTDLTTGSLFGTSMAISGDYLAVGAPAQNSYKGAVYVFQRTNGTWSQVAKLTASDAANNDRFGTSIAWDGTTLMIGAPQKNTNTGKVYTFISLTESFSSSGTNQGDFYGYSLSPMIIGAKGTNSQRGSCFTSN